MLSILIPCYNYSVNKLVQNIHIQTEIEKINYEIICAEDGSTKLFTNSKIKKLKNVRYIINKENIGRSKIRNYLAVAMSEVNLTEHVDLNSQIKLITNLNGQIVKDIRKEKVLIITYQNNQSKLFYILR